MMALRQARAITKLSRAEGEWMSQIEYHYQTVGRILVYLVARGLSRTNLDASDAMDIMTERQGDEEEVVQAFADCLQWMLAEGLIRAYSVQEFDEGYDFNGVQLTALGVATIKRDPHDPDIGLNVETRVARKDADPIDAGLYTKIGEFVGSALGGLTKSLANG